MIKKLFFLLTVMFVFLLNIYPIKGSGNVITEERTVPLFHSITFGSIGHLIIKEGTAGKIVINADDNIMPSIKTDVQKSVLIITINKIVTEAAKIEIIATIDNINELNVNGSGKIDVQKKIVQDSIKMKVTGSGNILSDVDTKFVNASILGSGSIDISGKTTKLEVDLGGSGLLNTLTLSADEANISIGGTAVCKVLVNSKMNINLTGGTVQYKGTPKINLKAAFAGSLEALE
ncbi:MAG: DUF2807 domain-containing protein [Spirochaetes bacterium]|nr:DUF2807 domain-containing protein [Spirochaetota bacterium]